MKAIKTENIIDMLMTAEDDTHDIVKSISDGTSGVSEEIKFVKAYLTSAERKMQEAIKELKKAQSANEYCRSNKQTFIITADGKVRKAKFHEVIKAAENNPNSNLL